MKTMKIFRTLVLACIILSLPAARKGFAQNKASLLIRVDDIGMCHSVNMAMKQLAETGLPFSASVMFACPWYLEAVEILQAHPDISVGIHLTLNSEWKSYKWGPVSGRETVASLVDSNGHFFASHADFNAHAVKVTDVEKELRAQIERALQSGLQIDYLDYHMGTAMSRPDFRDVVETLAKEYSLGMVQYFGEAYQTIWHIPVDRKQESLLSSITNLHPDKPNLMVIHIASENSEIDALFDMDSPLMRSDDGVSLVGKHRQAELNALCSSEFREAVQNHGVKLITYRDLIAEVGLGAMKLPE